MASGFTPDPNMLAQTKYGIVVYLGKKVPFRTRAYDPTVVSPPLPPDTEGYKLYYFDNQQFFDVIHSRMARDYFQKVGDKTGIYEVYEPPERGLGPRRPTRAVEVDDPVEYAAQQAKYADKIELTTGAAPKPKSNLTGVESSIAESTKPAPVVETPKVVAEVAVEKPAPKKRGRKPKNAKVESSADA